MFTVYIQGQADDGTAQTPYHARRPPVTKTMFTVYSGRRLSTRARETKTMFTYSKPTPSIERKRAAGHAGGGARARVAAGRVEGRRRNGAAP